MATLQDLPAMQAMLVLASGVRRGAMLAGRAEGIPASWLQDAVRFVSLISSIRRGPGDDATKGRTITTNVVTNRLVAAAATDDSRTPEGIRRASNEEEAR